MAVLLILFFVVACVVIIAAKFETKPKSSPRKVVSANSMILNQVANDVRIMMDCMNIINSTKNYGVKTSRTKLMLEVLGRLEASSPQHVQRDASWDETMNSYRRFAEEIKKLESRRYQKVTRLKYDRTATKCPYCTCEVFIEGSRMLKCSNCGKTAARVKLSKDYSVMATKEESQEIKAIEEEAINTNPLGGETKLTVSPEVGLILMQMQAKLSKMA